ncbi:MAG: diguanylate cyclase [Pseudomonadota bacterium]|nr:diguanylate cyclase [Pseudomonadota bacterium]
MSRLTDYLSQHLLRKIPIRQRLIGAFVLLALLPLVISGVISYAASTAAIAERTRVLSTEVVKQVAKNIELGMAKLESDSEALVLSARVQGGLAHYAGGDEVARAAARRELLRALLERYGSFDFINQKYLLDRDNRIIDAQVFATLGRGVEGFAARAPKLLGRPAWSIYDNAGGQKSLVLLRAIHDKANNALLGSLFLGVRPSHFSAIFEDVDLGSGTDIFLFDADAGETVVRTARRGEAAPAPALAAQLRRGLQRGQRSGFTGYDGSHLAAFSQVADTSWFVVSTIPLAKLSTEAQAVRDKNVLIGLGGLLVSIALAVLLARSISAPLERLLESMRETESGNYAIRMTAEGKDELTQLARRFNQMAGQVALHHVQLEARVSERTHDLAAANGKLAALSMTDGLTGIANRRRFDEALAAELARAARAGAPLALLMLDVDFFKPYNDHYGHQQGDDCLRQLAALLAAHARRASDLAARYGGEEFVLIAADTDGATALALAESIRAAIDALQLPHARAPLGRVSVSIGVVSLRPDDGTSVDQLLRMADQALYRAKEQGRNQVAAAAVGANA